MQVVAVNFDQAQAAVDREDRLNGIHRALTAKRDRWVAHRRASGIEEHWRKCERLIDGTWEEEAPAADWVETLKSGPRAPRSVTAQSRVVINIVRPKVDQVVARHCEILLPTDDRNWALKPTPMPELAEIAAEPASPMVDQQTGQPMGQVAQSLIDQANAKAEAMQREIDDVLTECNYNGECRKAITDGVGLGTGVMKGPYPTVQRAKKWTYSPDGGATLQIEEKVVPASRSLPPWNLYPDPACGPDIHRGSGIFEVRLVARKELKALLSVPGYDPEALRKVLNEAPQRVRVAAGSLKVVRELAAEDDLYELWEYHGEVDRKDMAHLTAEQEDPLAETDNGMLVMVHDRIIGALDAWSPDKRLPYDVWCYRERADYWAGHGLPAECEHSQRVVTAAWRQVMDNAAAAAGYHLVVKKGQVVPYGGRQGAYTLTSRMVWEANEDVADVSKAFGVYTIDMRVQELLLIAEAAMKFADQETSIPQLLGGERGTAPETVGGMQILQANAQGPLRYRVKRFDDSITRGQIGGHYDWQMCYGEKNEAKGDYEIDVRGATHLLERDIQAQAILNAAAITADPRFVPHFDDRKLLEEMLKALRFPANTLKTIEQVEQERAAAAEQGGPPPDPRIIAAQMNMEAKQLDLQDRAAQREADTALQQAELAVKRETLAYNTERERAEGHQAMVDAQLNRELALAKLDNDQRLAAQKIGAEERLKALDLDSKHALFNAESALKVKHGSGI
jgi:hypothetical protein